MVGKLPCRLAHDLLTNSFAHLICQTSGDLVNDLPGASLYAIMTDMSVTSLSVIACLPQPPGCSPRLVRAVHYAVFVENQTDLDQLADEQFRLELGDCWWEEVFATRGEQR